MSSGEVHGPFCHDRHRREIETIVEEDNGEILDILPGNGTEGPGNDKIGVDRHYSFTTPPEEDDDVQIVYNNKGVEKIFLKFNNFNRFLHELSVFFF